MRKFLVYYRISNYDDTYDTYIETIELKSHQKANEHTFNKIINSYGLRGKEVVSWSLIEE